MYQRMMFIGMVVFFGCGTAANLETCSISADCLNGQVCVGGYCEAQCTTSVQCNSGQVCLNNVCQTPSGQCSSNNNCTSGQVCISGSCQNCANSNQCNAGQVCVNNACQAQQAGCTSSSQCTNGQVCQYGACVGGGAAIATGSCSNGSCIVTVISGWYIYAIAGAPAQTNCVVGTWPANGSQSFSWMQNASTHVLMNICNSGDGYHAGTTTCLVHWDNASGPALEQWYQSSLHSIGLTPVMDCNGNPNYYK